MIPTFPETLTQLLTEHYGEALTRQIVEGSSARRPVTLRCNRLFTEPSAVAAALEAAGLAFERVPWYEDAFILPEAREDAVRALPLYEQGHIYLQSLSAMVPVPVLDPRPGETVLDMAAAPGGKTTQIMSHTLGQAQVTACERDHIRAERLRSNLEKQGCRRVMVMEQDARRLDDLFSFDRVLLDAPCSGSGTILLAEGEPQRRMEPAWLKKTAATQLAMLQKALGMLRKGHELVYSTCSILPMENEEVVRRAMARTRCEVVPVDPALAGALPLLPCGLPGALVIRPTALYEGFFVCRLRKLV